MSVFKPLCLWFSVVAAWLTEMLVQGHMQSWDSSSDSHSLFFGLKYTHAQRDRGTSEKIHNTMFMVVNSGWWDHRWFKFSSFCLFVYSNFSSVHRYSFFPFLPPSLLSLFLPFSFSLSLLHSSIQQIFMENSLHSRYCSRPGNRVGTNKTKSLAPRELTL